MLNRFILIIIPLIFSACSSKKELAFEKPEIQIPKKAPEPKKNKGSL
jgi:flagellar L-ring protein precursor FlgH